MNLNNSILAVGFALAAAGFPFSASARQIAPAPAPAAPIDVVTEGVGVTNYVVMLKSYDKQLFKTGKAQLTAKGEQALNGLATELRDVDYRIIDVAGHTDPTGSPAANRALAHQRATTIRTFLAKHGINAGRIFTDAQPIHGFGKCTGDRGKTLRECLAPDRSADVKVLARAVVQMRVTDTVFDQIEPVSAQ